MKLQKFENVDVIASLEAIMKQNTAFYQSDFDIDKQILRKAAVNCIIPHMHMYAIEDVVKGSNLFRHDLR